MPLRIINARQTRQLLPMSECIDAMEPAMLATSTGDMRIPPRLLFNLVDDSGFFAAMPGSSLEALGCKVVSFLPANPSKGLPAINGFVTLFDHASGNPLALIDGRVVTDVRTAAASGLAARHLARADASSCGILGTGAQADAHIDAMCAVRPVQEVVIWGRSLQKAQGLVVRHEGRQGIACRATSDPAEAGACDLVCTATISIEPVLEGAWLQPGAHVSLVGAHTLTSREADTETILKSLVYIDYLESTLNEGGDIMIPIQEGAIDVSHIVGEIGQLLNGEIAGRESEDEITLYNSLGVVSQDLFAALHVLAQAEIRDIGTVVDY
jgi:ornithine cyclodeaminase